jgi:uncharacterized protein DUF4214/beta-propeller repeat-containing protein/all-beta uncharacterized protein/parallel beta helix pectate lyase-like protein
MKFKRAKKMKKNVALTVLLMGLILFIVTYTSITGARTAALRARASQATPEPATSRDETPAHEVALSGITLPALAANTYTVTDTAGSLFVAILNANSNPGPDTIVFNIPTNDPGYDAATGVWTITLGSSGLPTITDPVTIDATTQPSYAGTPRIELNGTNVNRVALIGITSGNSVVRGLAINRMHGHGLKLATVGGNTVEGNFIGTDASGNADLGNRDSGIDIENSSNNRIGGTSVGSRNLISGNDSWGITISGNSSGNKIQGNLIGTNKDGTSALANATGVSIQNTNNNTIGVDADGSGAGNTIAFNGSLGVWISAGTGNRISRNAIFNNGSRGITLGSGSVIPNDDCDTDTGPNNVQNHPELTSASSDNSNTTIQGTLKAAPNSTYTIEFFSNASCDSSGRGEGQTFIGAKVVTTDSSCVANFAGAGAASFAVVVPAGQVITATAIDAAGNTSEFSACIAVTTSSPTPSPTPESSPTPTVTPTPSPTPICDPDQRYSVSPASSSFPMTGGPRSIGVQAVGGCPWTAQSNDSWITITSISSTQGPGEVLYRVAQNLGAARTGTITVAGNTITVTQAGPCIINGDPNRLNFCSDQVPMTINEHVSEGVTTYSYSSLTIDDDVTIADLDVRLFILNPSVRELTVKLISPDNVTVPLTVSNAVRAGRQDMGRDCTTAGATVFDDEATLDIGNGTAPFVGSFRPASPLSALQSYRTKGVWLLQIGYEGPSASANGVLECWSLQIVPVNWPNRLVLTPADSSLWTVSEIVLGARMTNPDGTPVSGVQVSFVVTGRNQGTSGTGLTGADGVAFFTYRDVLKGRGGTDTIIARATVGGQLHLGRAMVHWMAPPDAQYQCICRAVNGFLDCSDDTLRSFSPAADKSTTSNAIAGTLNMQHRFRDEVLSRSERGKHYRQLYYEHSGEVVRLLLFDPALFIQTKSLLTRYYPIVEAMVQREAQAGSGEAMKAEDIAVNEEDVSEIDKLFKTLGAKSQPKLRQVFEELRRDIHDPQVREEFRIKVSPGKSRGRPDSNIISLNAVGFAPIFSGFFLVFIARLGKNARSRARTRRRLCLLLAFAIGFTFLIVPLRAAKHAGAWGGNRKIDISGSTNPSTPKTSPRGGAQRHSKQTLIEEAYRHRPLSFEINQGQAAPEVEYLSRGEHHDFSLRANEAVFKLQPETPASRAHRTLASPPQDHSRYIKNLRTVLSYPFTIEASRPAAPVEMRLKFLGANHDSGISGIDELPGKVNYLVGNDTGNQPTGVRTFAKVKYEDLYRGVDAIYYGNQDKLEYDFIVAPHADPKVIRLEFKGADKLAIDGAGDLVLHRRSGEVRQHKPLAYQKVGGSRREVACDYLLDRNHQISFRLGEYDANYPLTIDPVISYSTYLGGGGEDEGNSIVVDAAGNAYITGFTDSLNFPTASAQQPANGGGPQDAFVTKLSPTGALIYSTYLGGNGPEFGSTIAVDASGNAYVAGFTGSPNFPTVNAMQTSLKGEVDAFVLKLNPAGTSLIYSTYLGGTLPDYGSGIAIDSSANAYITGVTASTDFPILNALQSGFGGHFGDAFITKLSPAGSPVYSTYLGGTGVDGGTSIAVDGAGNTYVTGATYSPNFPTANAAKASFSGVLSDAFAVKLNASGAALTYSTYLGSSGDDRGYRVTVDASGNAYITGMSDSIAFPTVNALQPANAGGFDAVIVKLNPSGVITYSTYFGGKGDDGATGIAFDAAGNIYVTGFTVSPNFPTLNAVQSRFGGGQDAFLAKLNSTGASLIYSTFLGGAGTDTSVGLAIDSSGNAFVLGRTDSRDFPMVDATQGSNGGGTDAFVTKISAVGNGPWEAAVLSNTQAVLKTWTIGGRTYGYVKLFFPDAGYRVANWGLPVKAVNEFTVDAAIERFSGASVQAVTTTAQIYYLGMLSPGSYNLTFKNGGTAVKTLGFTVDTVMPPANPIDDARQFVKQQYRDFLNREADQAGEDFWTDNITKCSDPARGPAGQTEAQCTLRQRETTSGAFFLSPEFQYTGYYVYRMYVGALGRAPKLSEFIPDAQFVGNGIIVNGQLSAAKINQNKADFAAQFANCADPAKYRCAEFKARYDSLNNTQYVDKLFETTGVNASANDRVDLVNSIGASETRASVLRKVVDGINVISEGNQQFTTTYGQAFYDQQFNRAFVQLEYFGYMKRDPDEAGYNFWLGKLNQFGGNFVNAEMVLAFISSPEYRARFGPP